MLIRQLARGVGLVQLLHQSVQFGVALLRLDNLFPAILDCFLLAQTGCLSNPLNKLLLVVADIPAYPLDGGEDRRFQLLRGNIVNGAISIGARYLEQVKASSMYLPWTRLLWWVSFAPQSAQ
mgnify:FL=1